MALRTPLGKVRGLGAAKEGTGHWWGQRVTAIALVPLVIWFLVAMIGMVGADYDTVRAWLGRPLVSVLLLLLLGTLFYHARLGLNVVIEDYVHGTARHLALRLLVLFLAVGLFVACAYAVLKTGFGG